MRYASVKHQTIMNQKKYLQSQINIVEARLQQYKESDLYTDEEKKKLINQQDKELEKLQSELAKLIDVETPEQL